MSEPALSELIFQKGKLKILRELLDNPGKDYSIKSLSDDSGASYDLTYRFSQNLIDLGILSSKKVGNSKILQLEENSPYTQKLRELIKIDSEPLRQEAKKYAQEVEVKISGVKTVVLFGSVAKGTPKLDSDIDILILVKKEVEEKEQDANRIASKYEREKNVTIVPMVETVPEFEKDLREETPFSQEIKKEGIMLTGGKVW